MFTVINLRSVVVICSAAFALVAAGCSKDPAVAKQEHFERAEQYVAEGKLPEAIIEYRNAVQIDPRFGQARYRLAEAYAQRGDSRAAFGEYVRAADLLDDVEVQIKAGSLLVLAGRYEDAKARADVALTKEPENTAALILRANAMAGLKDLDGAAKDMERAIAADPNRGLSYASLGAIELLRGNAAEAEAAYLRAVESSPRSAAAHVALGAFRLATGKPVEAEAAYQRAIEVEPDNPFALRALAGLYISSAQLAKAEPLVKRLVDASKDAGARLLLADIYNATNQIDAARAELQTLAAAKETATPAKLRLAAIEYTAGRTAEGHVLVDEVLKASPTDASAHVLKGRLLLLEKKVDDAIAQFQAGISANRSYDLAHFWLGAAYAGRSQMAEARQAFIETLKLTPTFVPAQVALSRITLRGGDADAALTLAQDAVRAAPRSIDARTALVWALAGKRDVARAQQELNVLVSALPNSPDVLVLQGALDMMRQNPASAEQAFAKALAVQPGSYEALAGMLQLQIARGDLAGAQARAQAAVTRTPDDAATLVLAARTHYAAQEFAKAEEALRKAIAADSSHLDAYALLGQLYVVQGRTDEAVREYDELAKRQSQPVAAHTVVGMLLQSQNKRGEAKARYQKVLELDPSAAVAANNLAWLQVEDGENLDLALQLAQTAKSRLPNSPEVSDTLGYIYYLKGLYPSAIDAFKVGVQKDPRNPMYQFRLGMAYAKSGQAQLARQSLDRALRLNPNFAGANEARQTLASLPM